MVCTVYLDYLDFWTFIQISSFDLSHLTFLYILHYVFIKTYFQPHFALQHSSHFLQEIHFLVSFNNF